MQKAAGAGSFNLSESAKFAEVEVVERGGRVYIYIYNSSMMYVYIYILDSCNTSFVTLDLKVFLTIWLSQYVHKLSFHSQGQKAWALLSFRAHLLPKGMGQHGSSLPAVQLA